MAAAVLCSRHASTHVNKHARCVYPSTVGVRQSTARGEAQAPRILWRPRNMLTTVFANGREPRSERCAYLSTGTGDKVAAALSMRPPLRADTIQQPWPRSPRRQWPQTALPARPAHGASACSHAPPTHVKSRGPGTVKNLLSSSLSALRTLWRLSTYWSMIVILSPAHTSAVSALSRDVNTVERAHNHVQRWASRICCRNLKHG